MVESGEKVVDIGTDHALLPCYLVMENISPFVIASDIKKGPYERACHTVNECSSKEKIELRLGSGLTVIKPGEVQTAIIAGMGGNTIQEIFEESIQIVKSLNKVILQPMSGADVVRYWINNNGWFISEEELVYEDNKYYQIIVGKPRNSVQKGEHFLKELEAIYGALLIKKRHPLLKRLVEKDMLGLQEIIDQLAKSKSKEAKYRSQDFMIKYNKLRELKEWL